MLLCVRMKLFGFLICFKAISTNFKIKLIFTTKYTFKNYITYANELFFFFLLYHFSVKLLKPETVITTVFLVRCHPTEQHVKAGDSYYSLLSQARDPVVRTESCKHRQAPSKFLGAWGASCSARCGCYSDLFLKVCVFFVCFFLTALHWS